MTDDEVLEAVRRLVVAGEYLDDIPGRPGARLELHQPVGVADPGTGEWRGATPEEMEKVLREG